LIQSERPAQLYSIISLAEFVESLNDFSWWFC
jgi:hypothetical protein